MNPIYRQYAPSKLKQFESNTGPWNTFSNYFSMKTLSAIDSVAPMASF